MSGGASRGPLRLMILCPYPIDRAPNQRFRFEQYLPAFAAAGWSVDVRPLMSDGVYRWFWQPGRAAHKAAFLLRALLRRAREVLAAGRYDTVLVVRECLPAGPAFLERLLRRAGSRLVFDFDDAIWLPSTSEPNRLGAWLKSPGKTATIVALADLVIAGNDYLADYARSHGATVTVIPTTIDTDRYLPREHHDGASPTVGWSGSPTTAHYLDLIVEPLRELRRDMGISILTIGAPRWRPPDLPLEAHPWALENEVELLRRIDVGLMPLTDDPWSRGKCGLKALQYMALGSTTIVSPVGVNSEIVTHDVDGLHASTADEWYEAIARCVRDTALRARLGAEARRTVERRYSARVNAERWLAALAR